MNVMANVVRGDIDDTLFDALYSSGQVACDIETSGLDPRRDCIGTVQLYSPNVGDVIVQVGDSRPERLCRLIEYVGTRKIFHHAMFDLRFMVAHWGVVPANIACTKIASKLVKRHVDNRQHSLQSILMDRLGVAISKDQRLSDWTAAELTPEQIRYAAADVEYLIPLLADLEEDLRSGGLMKLFGECLSFIPARVQLDLGDWPDVFAY
jgi:ribonuclease D